MTQLVELIPPGSRVLEFGAGTGEQARFLSEQGYDVVAIDLLGGDYSGRRRFPVIDYDGRRIPLPDASVDVIFSSNVMEHVEDIPAIMQEFKRILRPGGFGIHAMPTPSWRFWTFVAGVPTSVQSVLRLIPDLVRPPQGHSRSSALKQNAKTAIASILPIGHGTSREGISELWTFSRRAWRNVFRKHGFEVLREQPIGIFYTGHMLFGKHLSFPARQKLSRWLGSATNIYMVR